MARAGTLASLLVDADGSIQAVYDNGEQRTAGQLLLADFSAPDRLQRIGSNLFVETRGSGEALYGPAGSAGRGKVVSGALEQSNVDLSRQLVDLISFQRGYQASARTVATADQMLQDLVKLKR